MITVKKDGEEIIITDQEFKEAWDMCVANNTGSPNDPVNTMFLILWGIKSKTIKGI